MALIRNPRPFTVEFGVPVSALQAAGLFDPVLNADTPLFIDPLLLSESAHPLVRTSGAAKVRKRFSDIYKLLAVRPRSDAITAALEKLLRFREVAGTCLGYTAGGISGHGFGRGKSERFFLVATQVEEAGRSDPDLLPLLAVLEPGIGPDLISDMTTNIIIDELCQLTAEFCAANGVPTSSFKLGTGDYQLPTNPCVTGKPTPVLLVPNDILRELPIADSWTDVVRLAQANNDLRGRVNEFIADIMKDTRLSADKQRARAAEELQAHSEAVARVGEYLASLPRTAYDTVGDPHSQRALQRIVGVVENLFPLTSPLPQARDAKSVVELVRAVVEQFRFLVEHKGLWVLLWSDGKRLREEVAQRIFHAVAFSYCASENVHIAVEHHTGNGRTDFIFSRGSEALVVVELKWSDNPHLLNGYNRQVREYITAEGAIHGFYVVLDCDGGKKYAPFAAAIAGKPRKDTTVILVDANPKTPPSKPPL